MTSSRRPSTAPRDAEGPDADATRSSAVLVLLEARAPAELASLLLARPWLRKLPRGDGIR